MQKISCQIQHYAERFLGIIPQEIDPSRKLSPKHFTRKRKLPFPKLITFLCSLVSNGKGKGVEVKSGEFFRTAKRNGLWPEAEAVHHSAFTRAREKVSWYIFRDIMNDAVKLAYECWPQDPRFTWHGMSVYGTDGSKYTLPATAEIRDEFDPKSGLQYSGKGHYPQCLVSTVYDLFRRLPIARTVVPANSSEREEVKHLLKYIPLGCVLLFDRGYPSYELIRLLVRNYRGYFIFRCPSTSTFPAVRAFIESGKQEDEICIDPSSNYLSKISKKQRKNLKAVKLRIIRLISPDGTVSVLLTNLYDKTQFPADEIISLYFRRWEIETYYRDEKTVLAIEEFHGKTSNSIRQELFAVMIMSVISRTLMVLSQWLAGDFREPQFKNAVMTLASEAAVLAADDPGRAVDIFQEILEAIRRVIYYRPKKPRPSSPRVTKRSLNKWAFSKTKKVLNSA
jgi:hypothetical protein